LLLPVHGSGHSTKEGIQVLLSRDQGCSILLALVDSSGFV
jgi:hypothetical protein